MSETPSGDRRSSQRKLLSPVADEAIALHDFMIRSKPTQELVADSIGNAAAAVRSGEVARVSVHRVLYQDSSVPVSIASSAKDILPKKLSRGPVPKKLYF